MNDIDHIMESFGMDPWNSMCDPEMLDLYTEADEIYLREMITEAADGTKKKNIFQKLWDLIKKAVKWIANKLAKVINFIKGLFKKKQEPIDDIVASVGIQPNPAAAQNNGNNNDQKTAKVQTVKEKIPSSEDSEMQMPLDVDVPFKPFKLEYDKAANQICFSIDQVNRDNGGIFGKNRHHGPVPGQDAIVMFNDKYILVLAVITHPDCLDALMKCVELFRDDMPGALIRAKYEDFSAKYIQATKDVDTSQKISLETLTKFQVRMSEANKVLEKLDSINEQLEYNYDTIDILNYVSSVLFSLQMGVNAITATCQYVFTIDAKYREAVSDVNQLGQFVNKCINAGIPPKYIAYNSYLLCTPSIKGDNNSPNQLYNPIWGQTRFTFFPPNSEILYKMPLSGIGIRANKTEAEIYNAFNKAGKGDDYLTAIPSITSDNCVQTVEKIDIKASKNRIKMMGPKVDSLCRKLEENINEVIKQLKLPVAIGDIHENNIGLNKHNKWVILDYGSTARTRSGVPIN
jgi:hypothetical protein